MGVDYNATFGFGVELKQKDIEVILREPSDPEDIAVYELFEGLSLPAEYYSRMSGNQYGDRSNLSYFVFIKNIGKIPLVYWKDESDNLIAHLRGVGFTVPDECGVVGDLSIS